MRGHEARQSIRPLHEDDAVRRERFLETEFVRFVWRFDAIEIEMFDGRQTAVAVPERKRGTRNIGVAAERAQDGRNECGFSRAEIAAERHDVARNEGAGEVTCERVEGVETRDGMRSRQKDVLSSGANLARMWWRANDVLVGVITGVFAAVVAALFEAVFVTARFLSFGHAGGGLGSKIAFIAVIGALVGGIVGFFVGAVIKPRPQIR